MFTRRSFNKSIFVGAIGSSIIANSSQAQNSSANDRLQLGFIGVGTMGRGHLGNFLGMNDVQVVAVSDVVDDRLENAKMMVEKKYSQPDGKQAYKGLKVYKDFRDLINDKNIDGVVISTPDHWHALICVMASKANKHIYCEKPLTHSIAEGRIIVDEVKRSGVVFQTGSQQRSELGKLRLFALVLVLLPLPVISKMNLFQMELIGIFGKAQQQNGNITRCFALKVFTHIFLLGECTGNTQVVVWPIWEPIILI